ncbi:uncharacterized protein EDB91DRAFT_1082696 [Suillus paluster]|uniref:uncharacterized protein n=1 Tax=Suillus paluster TaxID=48578 RepID=UPI001B87805B|nr:uncharacterized protein EDB91DRAFT_1082696 [Suillus paluster]KAG1738666.1 hypothetical protein EDB91DRAFT_1082696 [Suillus paluster]
MLDSLLDSDSNLEDSDSNILSDSGHDSDDAVPWPVAPPSTDSSMKHLQVYIKQLQLEKGKLEEHNAALNATNGTLAAQQLKHHRCSPNQISSAAASSCSSTASLRSFAPSSSVPPSSAPLTTTSIITSETIIDKLILGLAKKYALMTEMFLPEKKSTEKAALVTELYASIDHEMHAEMQTNSFFNLFATGMQQARSSFFNGLHTVAGSIFNMSPEYFVARYDRASAQQITDMIGWRVGKGKTFDVFKAPILYPGNIVDERNFFRNWLVIAKVIKVSVCGKMSLFPKGHGGPPTYAKIWKLNSCTPGMISFGVTSIIFMLSPDQEFSGDGIGAISSIPYYTVFCAVKRFFIIKWTHECIKTIVGHINSYVFDNVAQTEQGNTSGKEDMIDSVNRVMAALDDSDSSSNKDPTGSDSLGAHYPTIVEPSSLTASSVSNTIAVASPLQHEPPLPSDVVPSISTQGALLNSESSTTCSEPALVATVIAAPHLKPASEDLVAVATKSKRGPRGKGKVPYNRLLIFCLQMHQLISLVIVDSVLFDVSHTEVGKPELTFIVIGKQHHVRFFPKNRGKADRSGNCPTGFIADKGVGNPAVCNFYLQSHGGLLGTSRPSHYITLRDDIYKNNTDNPSLTARALKTDDVSSG